MNDRMVRFLKSINLNVDEFDLDFDYVGKDLDGAVEMNIVKDTPWTLDQLEEFLNALNGIKYPYRVNYSYRNKPSIYDALQLFSFWYKRNYISECNYEIGQEEDTIVFSVFEDEYQNAYIITKDYKDFLNYLNYQFDYKLFSHKPDEGPKFTQKEIKKAEKLASKEADEFIKNDIEIEQSYEDARPREDDELEPNLSDIYEKTLIVEMENNLKAMEEDRKRKRVYQKGDYHPCNSIQEVRDNQPKDNNVDFFGKVFEITIKNKIRQEGINATFGVAYNDDAIYVRASSGGSLTVDKLNSIKNGDVLRVRGYPRKDRSEKDIEVQAHFIDKLPPFPSRVDNASEKRVELHLHTKYSAFDGLSSIMEYAKLAKELGHKAIAVTDHGVAQAYPEAQAAEKETGVRMIYGSELYMVDNTLECAFNLKDIRLSNATYVVFDFETTGLSRRYDQIIQFGAVKYKNGLVIDSMDLYITPTIPIPEKITQITGIDLKWITNHHGVDIKTAIKMMEDFIGDSILVSHNAKFDIGFMNQARIHNGFEPINNGVIDTLAISRYLFPGSKRHNLGALTRNLDLTSYNEDEAHKADFDAKVLGEVWYAILTQLTKQNPNITLTDLSKFEFSKELLMHYRPNHVTVLCKNAVGMKNLYKLISLSHIDYFADVPKVPRTDIVNLKEGLLLGTACQNGEIFDIARTRTEEELIKALEFYDFVEIQPLPNFSNLVYQGQMDYEEIKRTLLDIISAAKKAGKPVCITGDVHYANPEDKIYRDIYIVQKGIGGKLHPLNPFSRQNLPPYPNPDQHYRTTEEMYELFDFLTEEERKEYIVDNPNKIADMCESLKPVKDKLYKPSMPNAKENLIEIVFKKAHKLYGDPLPTIIEERLNKELAGICDNGYAVTYLIARDIILKANSEGYIVGSRGSVGSSLVATMADITEINPLPPHYRCTKEDCKHFELAEVEDVTSGFDLPDKMCPKCGHKMIHDGQNIPFETFLGFHAEKVPDIDLNFPPDYQAKAHEYTKVLFGKENVFRAGTIGTVAEKTARGYVINFYEKQGVKVDDIPRARLSYLASKCIDVKRTTGQHPGGIVVIPKENDVYDFCPIQYPADELDANWKTTHFEFKAIHDTLLKLDLLGHDDPMAIKMMCDSIGKNYKEIPLNDKKVLSLFTSDKALNRKSNYLGVTNGALGLPEFGTNFVRGMLDDTKPKTFADLVKISGLSHGTDVWQNNAEELIKNKIVTIKELIGCRDDIMEFLLNKGVTPSVAFSTMESVRKGHKIKPEFLEELKTKGVPEWFINCCNKIQYMFPKAHACAYVSNAIRIAYFKVYYPLEYYAMFFTIRSTKYDIKSMSKGEEAVIYKINELKTKKTNSDNNSNLTADEKYSDKDAEIFDTLTIAIELYERGYKISNIDLYKSDGVKFIVDHENNAIIPPFRTIDGLGDVAAISIVEARKNGEFTSKEDLLSRTKLSQTHIKQLEELGVLDGLSDTDQMSLFDF